MKKYIVFHKDNGDYNQESIPLSLTEAHQFLFGISEEHPDRDYVIMTEVLRG